VITATITGMDEIAKNLELRQRAFGVGLELGLRIAGDHLLRESQNLVPVEYGKLKASGYLTVIPKGLDSSAQVGYAAPYALFVHENVEEVLRGQTRASRIGTYWSPGQSKFLEEPLRRMGPELLEVIRLSMEVKE
jgi:hypothetical protein